MRYFSFGFVIVISALSAPAVAQLTENFDYADGPLTTVSNGAWFHAFPLYDDATVTNGRAITEVAQGRGETDVERNFNGLLGSSGDSATFSFDFGVTSPYVEGYPSFEFWLSPWDPVNGQLTSQSIEFVFRILNGSNVEVFSDSGLHGDLYIGTVNAGTIYTFSGTMTRAQDTVNFTLGASGTPLSGAGSFSLVGSNSLNQVELYGGVEGPGAFDNISLQPAPEPGGLAVLLAGTACVLRHRRRKARGCSRLT